MVSRKSFGILEKNIDFSDADEITTGEWLEIARELDSTAPKPRKSDSIWNYVVNSDMSGMPVICESKNCRHTKLMETAAFAGLYADQVVLYNPISSVLGSSKSDDVWLAEDANSEAMDELKFAVSAYLSILPLIESGIATFVDFQPEAICVSCLDKALSHRDPNRTNASNFLTSYSDFLNSAVVRYDSFFDGRHVFCLESEFLNPGHEVSYFFAGGEAVDSNFRDQEFGTLLSKEQIHKLHIFQDRAFYGSADLIARNVTSEKYSIGSIFADGVESQVMKKVFGKDFVASNFDADMPFLISKNLNAVLHLRNKYSQKFLDFRQVFTELSLDLNMSRTDVNQILEKEILPLVNDVEMLIERERRQAKEELFDSSMIAAAAIASSVLTAGLSGTVAAAAGALGGGHFAKSAIPAMRKLATEPVEARDETMYFAWKVKKLITN